MKLNKSSPTHSNNEKQDINKFNNNENNYHQSTSSDFSKTNKIIKSKTQTFDPKVPNHLKQYDEFGDEIILSGTDYWVSIIIITIIIIIIIIITIIDNL